MNRLEKGSHITERDWTQSICQPRADWITDRDHRAGHFWKLRTSIPWLSFFICLRAFYDSGNQSHRGEVICHTRVLGRTPDLKQRLSIILIVLALFEHPFQPKTGLLKKDLSSDPTSSKTFFFSFSFVEFIKCAVMSLKRIGLSSLELRSRWMRLLSLEPKPKRVSPSEAGTKKNFCQSARAR